MTACQLGGEWTPQGQYAAMVESGMAIPLSLTQLQPTHPPKNNLDHQKQLAPETLRWAPVVSHDTQQPGWSSPAPSLTSFEPVSARPSPPSRLCPVCWFADHLFPYLFLHRPSPCDPCFLVYSLSLLRSAAQLHQVQSYAEHK